MVKTCKNNVNNIIETDGHGITIASLMCFCHLLHYVIMFVICIIDNISILKLVEASNGNLPMIMGRFVIFHPHLSLECGSQLTLFCSGS